MKALDPEVTIEEFFKAPVVNRSWKVNRVDPTLTRFGLMWKIYDIVALKGHTEERGSIRDEEIQPIHLASQRLCARVEGASGGGRFVCLT